MKFGRNLQSIIIAIVLFTALIVFSLAMVYPSVKKMLDKKQALYKKQTELENVRNTMVKGSQQFKKEFNALYSISDNPIPPPSEMVSPMTEENIMEDKVLSEPSLSPFGTVRSITFINCVIKIASNSRDFFFKVISFVKFLR